MAHPIEDYSKQSTADQRWNTTGIIMSLIGGCLLLVIIFIDFFYGNLKLSLTWQFRLALIGSVLMIDGFLVMIMNNRFENMEKTIECDNREHDEDGDLDPDDDPD